MKGWRWRLKFSQEQPRVPAGNPEGGQWTSGGGIQTIEPPRATGKVTLKDLRHFAPKSKYVDVVADSLSRAARYGDLPLSVDTAIYGIGWAVQTGRLSGTAEMTLRKMDVPTFLKLVVEVANKFTVSAEIPAYLNEKYK
jgi:hypothetical protein